MNVKLLIPLAWTLWAVSLAGLGFMTLHVGLSLDYYLNEWKDGVYGEHPEGWDRLRAAITRRRAQNPPASPPNSAPP